MSKQSNYKSISAKRYNNPEDIYGAYVNYRNAVTRCRKNGTFINTDPRDVKAQLEIYAQAHRLNLQCGQNSFSVDHIIEIADGGSQSADNLQILTKAQHAEKTKRSRAARLNKNTSIMFPDVAVLEPFGFAVKHNKETR